MDLFNMPLDPFDIIESESLFVPTENPLDDDLNDLIFNQPSTETNTRCFQSSFLRPIDLPSHRKHYGLLSFYHYRIPILFRLANNYYVPYIRFSYALNVLDQHQSNRLSPILEMVKNLPILEMTSIEQTYYDRLIHSFSSTIDFPPENHPEWSNRLLSVALLDCLIGILDCSTSFFQNDDIHTDKWDQILATMREEVKSRWTIEEKFVLNQVEKQTRQANHEFDSLCVSSTNIAQRRLFFEKRLDLSIVDESGGFVQIDAFIFPYVKYASEDRIFININDLHRHFHEDLLLPSSCFHQFSSDSCLSHAYNIISEQARENFFWNSIHGNVTMTKYLPNPKHSHFQLKFLSLDLFLQAKGFCFVQLFEQSSLEYLLANYQNQIAREFILDQRTRTGGLINFEIPFIQNNNHETYIPIETKSSRLLTNDERLFCNCLLLYHNLWHMVLITNHKWYAEEIDMDIQSSVIEFCDQDYYEKKQRKLFVHS